MTRSLRFGFASGVYDRRPDDGLTLIDCAIVNAVRCVPPQNKPTPLEISACRTYLTQSMRALGGLKVVLALGRVAHETVLRAVGARLAEFPFAHGARHALHARGFVLFDSYHCSRYNTNTGMLTEAMFHDVFAAIRTELTPSERVRRRGSDKGERRDEEPVRDDRRRPRVRGRRSAPRRARAPRS